jgi:hypothetical protein
MKNLHYYLHGLLFAFIAPVTVYVVYQDASIFTGPASIWNLVIFCVCLFAILSIGSCLLVRKHLPAGLIAMFAILGILHIWHVYLVIMVAILLVWALLGMVGRKIDLVHAHISALAISLSIFIYFGTHYIRFIHSADRDEYRSMAVPIKIEACSAGLENRPDIYYIVLDGYGGAGMLQDLHGYDNSGFISELEARGFIVPNKSRSNYPRTILSLSSSLNMQYLDSVSESMGDSYLWWPLHGTMANNETRKFLESQGYQTVGLTTNWDFTTITDADIYKRAYPITLNKFEEVFIDKTNLSVLKELGNFGVAMPTYETHRGIVLHEFQQLREIPAFDTPKFAFVHIISPHPPFIFDSQGNSITPDYPFTFSDDRDFISPPSKYRKGYLEQLEFINAKTLEAVDEILKKSATPPIIIIQGDHGPGIFNDFHTLDNSCPYERYSILNAYYLPGVGHDAIPEDITPVNTFRMVFNLYFSANLEMLPNRQYFSPSSSLFQFEEVTDRVDDICIIPESDRP